MIPLFRSELLRIMYRRSAQLSGVAVLALIVIVTGANFARSHNDAESQREARAVALQNYQSCIENNRQSNGSAAMIGKLCSQSLRVAPTGFRYRSRIPGWVSGLAVVFGLVALGLGSAMTGSEWTHGTFASALLQEPRRTKVIGAKFGAFIVLASASAFVAFLLFCASHLLVASFRGSLRGVTTGFAVSLFLEVLRSTLVVAWAATIGCTLAFILGSASVASAISFGYLLVADGALSRSTALSRWRIIGSLTALSSYKSSPGFAFAWLGAIAAVAIVATVRAAHRVEP